MWVCLNHQLFGVTTAFRAIKLVRIINIFSATIMNTQMRVEVPSLPLKFDILFEPPSEKFSNLHILKLCSPNVIFDKDSNMVTVLNWRFDNLFQVQFPLQL